MRFVVCTLGSLAACGAQADESGPVRSGEICKAAIAAVMDRDPAIMRVRPEGAIIHVEYVLGGDGAVWGYRCRLDGRKVMWASAKGRWNTHPKDPEITYELGDGGSQVRIRERQADGSGRVRTFPRSRLR